MSCHESLVREFLQKTETGLCLDGIRTKRSTKCSLEHVSRGWCRVQTTGGEMSSVGQLVVMPGAGLGTEEGRAVTVGINIMTHASTRLLWVTITFTSIMQSTILQHIFSSSKALNVRMVLIMMRYVQMLIRAGHCCLKTVC